MLEQSEPVGLWSFWEGSNDVLTLASNHFRPLITPKAWVCDSDRLHFHSCGCSRPSPLMLLLACDDGALHGQPQDPLFTCAFSFSSSDSRYFSLSLHLTINSDFLTLCISLNMGRI